MKEVIKTIGKLAGIVLLAYLLADPVINMTKTTMKKFRDMNLTSSHTITTSMVDEEDIQPCSDTNGIFRPCTERS